LNVQFPGESGELEPFVSAHNAKFVGLLSAFHFRRSRARIGAVNYGTANTVVTPVSSRLTQELAFYYQELLAEDERSKESEELYEKMALAQIEIENWIAELRADSLEEETRRELLIKIDKSLVELEVMAGQMEKLANA